MTFGRFIWKNGTRNKRRTILTVLSVALTLFVLIPLVTFVNELDRRLEETNSARLVTRHAVIWIFPIPERYRMQIEKIPGIVANTPLTYYGGVYVDRAHTDFAQYSCDPQTLFDVFPELKIPDEQRQAFINEQTAVVVGRSKADKHGWKIGDRINLKGAVIPVDLELIVRGIFSGSPNEESNIYFHHTYLNQAVEAQLGLPGGLGEVSTYWIRADSPASVPRISQAIDELFVNTDKPTRTETEKSFQMSFVSLLGNIKYLIATISALIIFTILLVTANTMAMSVRERVREIAVLKALGFRRRRVLMLLMAEGVMITLMGGLLGTLAAHFVFRLIDIAAYTQGSFQRLDVTWSIIALGLIISGLVGVVSTGVPAYQATKLTVAEGLRNIG
ncbi:MAG TPA: FtsX-like permease family protein [Pyrinomonadaceae bacterium]|jgi:putative ABC transport system permease protein